VAELQALEPALADLYRRAAEALAGAADAAAIQQLHVALLGREGGGGTLALGELPSLPVESRKVRGRGLNLIKRWLQEIEDARRTALEQAAEARAASRHDVTEP